MENDNGELTHISQISECMASKALQNAAVLKSLAAACGVTEYVMALECQTIMATALKEKFDRERANDGKARENACDILSPMLPPDIVAKIRERSKGMPLWVGTG